MNWAVTVPGPLTLTVVLGDDAFAIDMGEV
jgi:hypothetical protein